MFKSAVLVAVLLGTSVSAQVSPAVSPTLEVPAGIAYLEGGLRRGNQGIGNWNEPSDRITWAFSTTKTGQITLSTEASLPSGQKAKWKFRLWDTQRDVVFTADISGGASSQKVTLATLNLPKPGRYLAILEGVEKSGESYGRVGSLQLSGPAAEGAVRNETRRNNAPSVHLSYPQPKGETLWFYNEVTVREAPVSTFIMTCGFSRGYFGIQKVYDNKRIAIFSVWDSGNEHADRRKVDPINLVKGLAKGEGVAVQDFGNEGTGGKSTFDFDWKEGETHRFLLGAEPQGELTIYKGFIFLPKENRWHLMAAFRAPHDGKHLRGLYSFLEDWTGNAGHRRRMADFSNQAVYQKGEGWKPLVNANFTNTKEWDRADYGCSLENGAFRMFTGGFAVPEKLDRKLERPSQNKLPDIDFSKLPTGIPLT